MDILPQPSDRPVTDVLAELQHWQPLNYEHWYVSPGLIEMNIRRFREWEDMEHMTKAAVTGGVCLCVEEKLPGEESSRSRYCDVGCTAVLDAEGRGETADCMAVKGYCTSPDYQIEAIAEVPAFLVQARRYGLPVLMDPTFADEKSMQYCSPCRKLPLASRLSDELPSQGNVLGGTLLTDAASSNCTSEASDIAFVRKSSRSETNQEVLMNREELDDVRKKDRAKTGAHIDPDTPTLLQALDTEISLADESTELLARAEMMAYKGGETRYIRTDSNSLKPPEPESPVRRRSPRPSQIVVEKPKAPPDTVYLLQLAQYSPTMEARGVEEALHALAKYPGQLHLCNLASAAAVSLVSKAKESNSAITCETCPHFLYFTEQMVGIGETHLKSFPPIRNSANCNFLWELLKLNAVDAVATQHVPVCEQLKCKPSFARAVSGINGLGHTLQALWTVLKKPMNNPRQYEHYLIRLAKWTSANPAKILRLSQRGAIAKGYFADLVVWDPYGTERVECLSSQPQHCPYHDQELAGRILHVLVRGRTAYLAGNYHEVGEMVTV